MANLADITPFSLLSFLETAWHSLCQICIIVSVMFRSVLVKYSDRGLADDVFWFNGGLQLFDKLFWVLNLTLFLAHQSNWLVRFFGDCLNPWFESCSTDGEKNYRKYAFINGSNVIVLILYCSILWRKKHIQHRVNRKQQNILTLNQTVALKVLLTLDLIPADFLFWLLPQDMVLLVEMMKVIVVNNICYRFIMPLLLLLNTKKMFPELWSNTSPGREKIFKL